MKQLFLALGAALLTSTLSAQTDSATLLLQKGMAEKQKGRVMESYKYLDRAYAFNKKDRQITTELADVLFTLRRYPQAKEKYQQLETMGGASSLVYQRLADLSINMRQHDDAIRYAQLLRKTDPAQKTAFLLGKAFYEKEQYGEAIKLLNEAIKEDPANKEAPYYIARAYTEMNNPKQSLPYFEKALALDPGNSRLLYEMGLMYYSARDDKNALKYLLLAGEHGYRRDNDYLDNLAVAYLENKQFDQGINILKEALQRRPSDPELLNTIAEACYNSKKYDDAIGYWDRILQGDKENGSALYMIGMSYQKKGEKQKGQSLCDKAIQLDPSLAAKRQQTGQREW